jgi:hypothetical protein
MKTTFCGLCLLFATVARGQAPSGNSVPTTSTRSHQVQSDQVQSSSRAKHANSGGASARGERPHREAMPPQAEVPLGDTARTLKRKHATAKKARAVFEN